MSRAGGMNGGSCNLASVQVRFVQTEQDFVRARTAHAWRKYGPRGRLYRRILQPIAGAFFLAVAFYAYRRGDHGFAVLEGAYGFYALLIADVIAPYFHRKAFRRSRMKTAEVILTLTDEVVCCEMPGLSEERIQGDGFVGVLDWPEVMLLYLSPAMFLYVPKRVLSDAEHRQMLEWFGEKGVPLTYPKMSRAK